MMGVMPFIATPMLRPSGKTATVTEREKPRSFGGLPHLRRIGLSQQDWLSHK
jgi:hypothetical protein